MSASELAITLFTLRIAALATVVTVPLSFGLALALRNVRARWRAWIESAAALPLVLPPTAVGLVLLELFSRNGPFRFAHLLFTPAAAVVAASVMSFPLTFRAFRVSLDLVDFRYFGLARSLGKRPVAAFVSSILPLSWTGLLSGIVLGFCRSIGEFGATLLVAGNIPGRTQTLSLAIYERVENGEEASALPLVAAAVLIALAAMVGSEYLIEGQRRRRAQ